MLVLPNGCSCFNSQHVLTLTLLMQGTCAMIYILATWIFIAHFVFIVNIKISSPSAVKSASGNTGTSDCPRDYPSFYVTCWSSCLWLFHAPAFSIPMTVSVLHYSMYSCVGVRLRIFPFPSASPVFSLYSLPGSFFLSFFLSFFSSISLLSSLSLAQSVPFSFYPPCFSLFSSNYPYLSFVIISTLYLFLHNKRGYTNMAPSTISPRCLIVWPV